MIKAIALRDLSLANLQFIAETIQLQELTDSVDDLVRECVLLQIGELGDHCFRFVEVGDCIGTDEYISIDEATEAELYLDEGNFERYTTAQIFQNVKEVSNQLEGFILSSVGLTTHNIFTL